MEECPLFLLFICFFLQGLVGVILDGSKFSALHTVSGIKDTKNIPRPRTKIAVPKQRQLVSNSVSFTSFQYKRAETVLNLGTHVSQPCATGSSCTPASRIALPPCHPGALSHLLPQELRTSANGSCCPTLHWCCSESLQSGPRCCLPSPSPLPMLWSLFHVPDKWSLLLHLLKRLRKHTVKWDSPKNDGSRCQWLIYTRAFPG